MKLKKGAKYVTVSRVSHKITHKICERDYQVYRLSLCVNVYRVMMT